MDKILVVEDEPKLAEVLLEYLSQGEFDAHWIDHGDKVVEWVREHSPDLIVLDLMLPKIDGLTLLSSLREQQNDTHVLILTAKDTVEDRITGLNLGADDYLVKPFAFKELLARVQALVRRRYQQKSPSICLRGIEVDTTQKTVTRHGVLIDLTPREYALLEYLAFRIGEVVTRTEIWEHLYEMESSTTSNVVDVFIKRLREKLGPDLIHTKRGQGYVLVAGEGRCDL